MERVLIIGCSGAGKTTLAQEMAQRTGLPAIHLDREYWKPGWIEPTKAEWDARVRELIARPRWIMDGNYGNSLPLRLTAADTIVFLDFSTWLCLWRVIGRVLRWHGREREEMAPGCPERFDGEFLQWIWRWRRDSRPRTLAALEAFSGTIHVLRTPREVARFLSPEK